MDKTVKEIQNAIELIKVGDGREALNTLEDLLKVSQLFKVKLPKRLPLSDRNSEGFNEALQQVKEALDKAGVEVEE